MIIDIKKNAEKSGKDNITDRINIAIIKSLNSLSLKSFMIIVYTEKYFNASSMVLASSTLIPTFSSTSTSSGFVTLRQIFVRR